MSEMIECRCSKCGKAHKIKICNKITDADSELREKLMDGSLFVWECPDCGTKNLAIWPLLYTDNKLKVILLLTQENIAAEGEIPGFTARRVAGVGELVEKMKIFEAGLDDVAIELCKFVTTQEMKKDVPLKFLKIEGSEGEMIFTYPENGEMQMIEVGLNVYEDCCGIISRNAVLKEKAKGLVRIDREWISAFIAE